MAARKRVRSTYYRAVGLINRNVRATILVRLICQARPMTRGFITVERVALMETTYIMFVNCEFLFSFSSIGISIIKEIVLIVFVKINCTSFEQYNPLYGSSLHTRMKILFPFVRNFHRISELKCKFNLSKDV